MAQALSSKEDIDTMVIQEIDVKTIKTKFHAYVCERWYTVESVSELSVRVS